MQFQNPYSSWIFFFYDQICLKILFDECYNRQLYCIIYEREIMWFKRTAMNNTVERSPIALNKYRVLFFIRIFDIGISEQVRYSPTWKCSRYAIIFIIIVIFYTFITFYFKSTYSSITSRHITIICLFVIMRNINLWYSNLFGYWINYDSKKKNHTSESNCIDSVAHTFYKWYIFL